MTTLSAPPRLRPLCTATPQDQTKLETSLRQRLAFHAERTCINILPSLRTMLYAIPAESRSDPAIPAVSDGGATAGRPRRPRLPPLALGLFLLTGLLGLGAVHLWQQLDSAVSTGHAPNLLPR